MIIGAYALAGMVMMFIHRAELIRYKKTLPYLVWGGSMGFLMIVIDVLTNQNHIIEIFVGSERVKSAAAWLAVVENSFKVLAGTCFLLGSHDVLRMVRNERG